MILLANSSSASPSTSITIQTPFQLILIGQLVLAPLSTNIIIVQVYLAINFLYK